MDIVVHSPSSRCIFRFNRRCRCHGCSVFFSSSLISMLVLLEFLLRFYPKAMEQYENIQTHKTTNDEREREQDSDLPCLRYHSVESCSQHAHLTTTQPIIVHSSETIHVRKTTKSHSSDIIDGEFAPIYYIILEWNYCFGKSKKTEE